MLGDFRSLGFEVFFGLWDFGLTNLGFRDSGVMRRLDVPVLDFEIVRFWNSRIWVFWEFGIPGFLDCGALGFWECGFWGAGILRFWVSGMVGRLDNANLGLWDFDC